MTTTRAASIGSSAVTHAAHRTAISSWAITCGAVRYRNTGGRQGAIRIQPTGTEVTCTKCRKAAPTPVTEEAPAEELTFMQKQRLRGRAR